MKTSINGSSIDQKSTTNMKTFSSMIFNTFAHLLAYLLTILSHLF